ncbi:hypothetical protein FPQ18DRAFT_379280 [Pyronema domesticum]|nr:hypothetical protein FPQ18DRAFT_379280 [Pyronema domesticum]
MKPLGPLLFILPLLTAATDTCLPALQQCGELSPTPEINCCFGLSCLVSGRSGYLLLLGHAVGTWEPVKESCLNEGERCGRLGQELCYSELGMIPNEGPYQ